jgi:glycosyltransferase involved in cell wall biosynthesis
MKVCHFAATPGIGRGEAFVEIANAMASKTSTSLLVPDHALFLDRVSSQVQTTIYAGRGSRRNPLMLWELYRFFRKQKPDLVHTHFGKATAIFLFLNRFLGIPHLATKHNPRKGKAFEKSGHVTTVSKEAAKSIKNPRVSVTVIRNGIKEETAGPSENYSPKSPFPILAIGRLDPIKGFDRLIEETAKLSFDFHLTLAGEGDERDRLTSLAKRNLPANSFSFVGFRTDVPALMKNAALVVSSSLSEGCPMAMIEALFYGNALLSTPVGEAAEILPPEFLCDGKDLAKGITAIHDDYDTLRQKFIAFAEKTRPLFSASSVADQYLVAYDRVLAGKPFDPLD